LNVGGSEELLLDFPWSELLLVFASRQCLLLLYGSKVRREDRQGLTLLSLAKRRPIQTTAQEIACMAQPQQSGVGVGRICHGYVPADRAASRRGWAKVKASSLCNVAVTYLQSAHIPDNAPDFGKLSSFTAFLATGKLMDKYKKSKLLN